MKKINLIFALLLSLMGVTQVKAETLTENFENITVSNYKDLSNGWFVQGTYISTYVDSYYYGIGSDSDYKPYGNAGKSLYSMYGTSAQNYYVIIPQLLMGNVEFYYRAACSSRVSYTPFIKIFEVTESDGTYTIGNQIGSTINPTKGGSWSAEKVSIDLGTDGTMIAIQMFRSILDEFTYTQYEDNGAIAKPTDLEASNITSSSVELSWLAGGTESEWNLQYKKSSDENYSLVEGIANPYTLEGLSDGTEYVAQVQAVSGEDMSSWSKIVTFTTLVAPISTYPYTESFDNITSGIPAFWDNSEGTVTTASYNWNYYATGHEGHCVRFNSYNPSSGQYNILKTRPFSFAEGEAMKLSFWYKNPKGGDFSVYVSNDGGTTLTELATGLTDQADWKNETFTIDSSIFGDNVVFLFKGTSNWGSGDAYIYLDDVTVSIASMPELSVDPTNAADFGIVKEQPEAKTYTVTNTGAGTLNVEISSSDESFSVTPSTMSLAAGESSTLSIALVLDENYGEKAATITIHPTDEGLADVTIAATATTKDPNVWEEDFENGIPASWINDGWTIGRTWNEESSVNHASSGSSEGYLITPRLKANEGDELSFDFISNYATLVVEYANDIEATEWTSVGSYTDNQTITFTAPADGNYYLRFSGSGSYLDNFYGFQLDQLAADFMITASTLPTTGKQYATYEASVTVKNTGTEAQTAVAKLYFGTEEVDGQEAELAVDGEAVITLTYRPLDAVTFDEVSIEVTLKDVADVEAKTVSVQNVEIVAIPQLSEDGWTYDESTDYSTSGLQYSAKAGWNTIALPFAFTTDHLKKIFGENYKVYYCSGYSNGELSFRTTTSYRAGVPFIVYAESIDRDVDDLVVLENISITATEPSTDDAPFYGTYATMSMTGKYGVVPDTGKIAKGGVNATLKGFRGYFELPAGATGAKINFYDENDNLIDAIDAVELNNAINGNLYDLSGRKVEGKAKAGVYIQNGKKVVVK